MNKLLAITNGFALLLGVSVALRIMFVDLGDPVLKLVLASIMAMFSMLLLFIGVGFWWMKSFTRIVWVFGRRGPMLHALNILFWKVPKPPDARDTDEIARGWVAELEDKGLKVRWDPEAEEFK